MTLTLPGLAAATLPVDGEVWRAVIGWEDRYEATISRIKHGLRYVDVR